LERFSVLFAPQKKRSRPIRLLCVDEGVYREWLFGSYEARGHRGVFEGCHFLK
jgi:hypothetical protein